MSSLTNIQIKYFLFSLVLFAVFVLSGCSSQTQQTANQVKTNEAAQPVIESKEEIKTEETKEPIKSELYEVVNVVDGDTIKVNINGATETLRLIGIDTPETVDPRKPVQCFGKEASNKAKEILTGKKVKLEADSTQGERDKYNRLLRYVYLEDGKLFNKLMIGEGYAHEYTYQSNPYIYQTEFIEAEKQARETKKGLWGDLCGGNTTQSAETKIEAAPIAPAPKPVPSSSTYSCNCSKTCDQMGCAEAQYQLNSCGCSRRDADKDGIACDTQCQ